MQARRVGTLEVSAVGLGCNQLGTTCDAARSAAVIDAALDAGITFLDTADEYGDGSSEEVLGRALRGRRDRVVLATKFGGPRGKIPLTGAHPDWIRTAVQQSLERLGTEWIDLYQLHFPDPDVPIAETLGALDELVAAGLVREIGCSNLSPAQLADAADAAQGNSVRAFVSVQSRLNLLRRDARAELLPACERLGLAFIPYFPLASGMLTGKYRRGQPPPEGSRLALQVPAPALPKVLSESTLARIEELAEWAVEHGLSLHELAFAWLLDHLPVASVIAGATRPEQAVANAEAGRCRLDDRQRTELEELLGTWS
jgi:aryl-alcohol dehydrogenase-like predicted oxidoreductase